VRDRLRLLLVLMEELAGNAHISLEGDLSGLEILRISGASSEETLVLRRNTSWPRQGFIIVPLEPLMAQSIVESIGRRALGRRIIHVQIEKAAVLEFGAYDNFHPECIFFGKAVRQEVLESLISEGVLTSRPLLKG